MSLSNLVRAVWLAARAINNVTEQRQQERRERDAEESRRQAAEEDLQRECVKRWEAESREDDFESLVVEHEHPATPTPVQGNVLSTPPEIEAPRPPQGGSKSATHQKPGDAPSTSQVLNEHISYLLNPTTSYRPTYLSTKPEIVPDVAGVYGWYFDHLPTAVPKLPYFGPEGWNLLYVGISDNLRRRLTRMHMGKCEDVSTLHESLAALMPQEDIPGFLASRGKVAWVIDAQAEQLETEIIKRHGALLPLNIKKNRKNNPILDVLIQARKQRRRMRGGKK